MTRVARVEAGSMISAGGGGGRRPACERRAEHCVRRLDALRAFASEKNRTISRRGGMKGDRVRDPLPAGGGRQGGQA